MSAMIQLRRSRGRSDNDKAAVATDQGVVASDQAQFEWGHLTLGCATLKSPIDGAVGDRSVPLGAYVKPGQGLMSIVPMGRAVYVNFKETQIDNNVSRPEGQSEHRHVLPRQVHRRGRSSRAG